MKEFLQRFSIRLARSFYFFHKPYFKKLGKKSVIYKPMMIRGRKFISMGKNCFVRNGARIEMLKSADGACPQLIIGDNTTFEQRLHLTCSKRIVIGNDCVFSANIYISDTEHNFSEPQKNILEQGFISEDVLIGNHCFIGMGSFISAGTKLGNNVVVGANTILKGGEYPDDVMIVGGHDGRARIIKKYDHNVNQWVKV